MSPSTLYYLFSTVAQVLAATSALLAVIVQFKINEIKEFLVGDGISTLERMNNKEKGYDLDVNYKKYHDRLRDSVSRKSLIGILEVITVLSDAAQKRNETLKSNPRGLHYLELRYRQRLDQISKIKFYTKTSIASSFATIIASIILLSLVDVLNDHSTVSWFLIVFIIVATISCVLTTILGIFKGFKDQEDV
jgi:hypothetical protein